MAGSNLPSPARAVIITGASEGIGKALALDFAGRGYKLGLLARRANLLEVVKTSCLAKGAPEVFVSATDVCDEGKFEDALTTLDDQLGGSLIFIANAGVTGQSSLKADAWQQSKKTLGVNMMAAIHGLEFMKLKYLARGTGILVGVSSIAGARGLPQTGAYSSSKAALTTHLETLRIDLKPLGISVVTIAPGFIETLMTEANKDDMPFIGTPEKSAKVFVNAILKKKAWVAYPVPFRFLYPIMVMVPRCIFDPIARKLYSDIK